MRYTTILFKALFPKIFRSRVAVAGRGCQATARQQGNLLERVLTHPSRPVAHVMQAAHPGWPPKRLIGNYPVEQQNLGKAKKS